MLRLLVGVVMVWLSLASAGMSQDVAPEGEPQRCGGQTLSIAQMQWPSAAILAHVHADLLREQLGCDVQVVAGDLAATVSSMATTRQPAIAPEMWITRVADVWNSAVESQNVRAAGDSYGPGAMEGWFVPGFLAEANPELTKAAELKDNLAVFAPAGGKARFISCPPDWACAVINRNLIRALGLEDIFDIVEPQNRFEMDRLIAEAVSSKLPVVFYYWQPNAILAQFEFRQLDLGAYSAEAITCLAKRDCADPQPSAFPTEPVLVVLADWVISDVPVVTGYFQKARMPLAEMSALLAWQGAGERTVEDAARHFVETREEVWRSWVGGS